MLGRFICLWYIGKLWPNQIKPSCKSFSLNAFILTMRYIGNIFRFILNLSYIFLCIYPYTSATWHARASMKVGYKICALWYCNWRKVIKFKLLFHTQGHDARNGISVVSFLSASSPQNLLKLLFLRRSFGWCNKVENIP